MQRLLRPGEKATLTEAAGDGSLPAHWCFLISASKKKQRLLHETDGSQLEKVGLYALAGLVLGAFSWV